MGNSSRGPILFGVGLIVILAAIGGWLYFLQPTASLNVLIALATDPPTVLAGDPFSLSVTLTNDSGSALKNAAIALVLPANVASVDSPDQRVLTQPVGNIDAGGVSHESFNLVVTRGADTVAHFSAKVTYAAAVSSAQFENDGAVDIAIGQSAVDARISAPANVWSGQNFPIAVTYDNNTTHAIQGMSIAMQYPPAFSFVAASSSLAADGNNAWSLGTIPPNGSGTIILTGNLVGPNDASYPIGATLSENIAGRSYALENPVGSVVLASSPLSFSVTVDGAEDYVSHPGDSLNYTLTFSNNSTVTFQNIVISANLRGAMFNFPTLESAGSFNSITDTIQWNGADAPALLSLAPGHSGSVQFTIQAKSAFPIRLLSDKNYSVGVQARLASPTVPPGTDASSTISVAAATTKFGGNIVLGSKAYWRDPSPHGIAANTGPYPPKVNRATQYTMHWLITNYATDAKNVTISAYLQSGTTCTGAVETPASTTFACDPSNGQVTWQIPLVAATTGVTGKPLEEVFQVTNTPSINQIGRDIPLIGQATLTATDAFTSSTMQSSASPMTTALPDDTSVSTNQREVTQ